jgi:hypothetical protein
MVASGLMLLLIASISAAQVSWAIEHGKLDAAKKRTASTIDLPIEVANKVNPPDIIGSFGRVKTVALDTKRRWHSAESWEQNFRGGFIAEFLNRPNDRSPVGTAIKVRARVTLRDGTGAHTTADPAPWLNATSANARFEAGTAQELLLAIFEHEPDETTGEMRGLVRGIRDQRESDADRSYESTAWLYDRVVAEVFLTVDGVSKGPFRYGLDPGKPPSLQAQCRQIIPPAKLRLGGLYFVRSWFKRRT